MTRRQMPWLAVSAGAAIVFISMGSRQTLGIFLIPVTGELGTGREAYSLAVALQNLVMGLPLAGLVADRLGHRRVAVTGAVVYGAAMLWTSSLTSPGGLPLSLGLVAGGGLSALSLAVVIGAVGRVVPAHRRTFAFGLVTAGTSLGIFVLAPLAQWLLDGHGWRSAFAAIAALAIPVAVASSFLPKRSAGATVAADERFVDTLRRARASHSYLLLVAGFFVCGFHVAFISTHLPPYLQDRGVSATASALSLSMIGLLNIFGSMTFGMLGDRFRKRTLLAILYSSRAVLITALLLTPMSDVIAVAFGAAIGFVWLATAPLTSSTVAQLLGARYLTTLYGIVFFSHQVGAFLGVWLGGKVYDATGSYNTVWIIAIALGVVAALVHLPIDDRRVELSASDVPTTGDTAVR